MLLVIMESTYVMTGREIWKRMTRFWGMLFGINFAMGVATGITMEFQFGVITSYSIHYTKLYEAGWSGVFNLPETIWVWWNIEGILYYVIGKGIIRFHAVYWPAFLLSAGLV